jgi:hypothetical protein
MRHPGPRDHGLLVPSWRDHGFVAAFKFRLDCHPNTLEAKAFNAHDLLLEEGLFFTPLPHRIMHHERITIVFSRKPHAYDVPGTCSGDSHGG